MPTLFTPLTLRELTIPNRAWLSPMCLYSANPGLPGEATDFHYAHYAARAAGGAGLVMLESVAVSDRGRITPYDLGLWSESQVPHLARVAEGIHDGGAVAALQISHAGRKGSADRPWLADRFVGEVNYVDPAEGGWIPQSCSSLGFPGGPDLEVLTDEDLVEVAADFARCARLADQAGFDVVEIHAAHGYLLHSFLSPLTNNRTDRYGGSLENRMRFVLEVIDAVRASWPAQKPVFMRISMTDWVEENPEDHRESWTVSQSVELARQAAKRGVDLIDASSAGIEAVPIPDSKDFQTSLAATVRQQSGVPVAAVGNIADPQWANHLIADGSADAVMVGRALLRDPSWVNHAAVQLGAAPRYLEPYNYVL